MEPADLPADLPGDVPGGELLSSVAAYRGGPVEFERVVPASGNLGVAGKQFWLGPLHAGVTITFWADHQLIHLLVAGARIKTVRSHLSSNDLAATRSSRASTTPGCGLVRPSCCAVMTARCLPAAGANWCRGARVLRSAPATTRPAALATTSGH